MNAVLSMGVLLKNTKEQYEPEREREDRQESEADRKMKPMIVNLETPAIILPCQQALQETQGAR